MAVDGFHAVVVTAQRADTAGAYCEELERWKREGRVHPSTLILATPDATCKGASSVGSGGQMLNALTHVTDCLRPRLDEISVLILAVDDCVHASPSSVGLSPLRTSSSERFLCMDSVVQMIATLCSGQPPHGILLCRGGVMCVSSGDAVPSASFEREITLISSPGKGWGASGGFVVEEGADPNCAQVRWGESSERSLQPFAVHFSPSFASKLLELVTATELQQSTFLGCDSGSDPLSWDLWGDFLPALACGSFAEFGVQLGTEPKQTLGRLGSESQGLWAVILPNTRTISMRTFSEYLAAIVEDDGISVNSVLGGHVSIGMGSAVINSEVPGGITVGSGALVHGVRARDSFEISDGCQMFQVRLRAETAETSEKSDVLVLLSPEDDLSLPYTHTKASLLRLPPASLHLLVPRDQLWGSDVPEDQRTLQRAKLFPVFPAATCPLTSETVEAVTWMTATNPSPSTPGFQRWLESSRVSLQEVLARADRSAQLQQSVNLHRTAQISRAVGLLSSRSNESLLPILRPLSRSRAAAASACSAMLRLAAKSSPDIASRVLSNLADLFALSATAGPRAGPARHPAWSRAFASLRRGEQQQGITEIEAVLKQWVWEYGPSTSLGAGGGGDEEMVWPGSVMLLRASRHLEAASRLLTSQAIKTVVSFIDAKAGTPAPHGEWVSVAAPARIDLAGGWLDTPPVCYEAGGMVVNAAVLVDGDRPIGARVRRIEEAKLILKVEGGATISCSELSDLQDYDNPAAPAALLKSAFVALRIILVGPDDAPLNEQLEHYAGGFEVETWSHLPQGSGMGTSSILAGALVVALARAAGTELTAEGVVHVVLYVEQLMTTGGGWQDQCGGIFPGVKACSSPAGLPLHVTTEILPLSADALNLLSSHMVLIYTGKARLAATLLHDVLRRWHGRVWDVVDNIERLRSTAEGMREAISAQDIPSVGRHLSAYWEEKKVMAPDAEPPVVTKIIDAVQGLCHGCSLAGAGGGGYMVLITKQADAKEEVAKVVATLGTAASVHHVAIDSKAIL